MTYYQFTDEEGEPFGSFEVWYASPGSDYEPGWYWWACFAGCLPDSDAVGPFNSQIEAIRDAESDHEPMEAFVR